MRTPSGRALRTVLVQAHGHAGFALRGGEVLAAAGIARNAGLHGGALADLFAVFGLGLSDLGLRGILLGINRCAVGGVVSLELAKCSVVELRNAIRVREELAVV